jgi:ketosteroid isomerase-like protein
MSEESTIPDLVELTRDLLESVDRDWDLDALADFFEPEAVMDMSRLALGNREGWAAIGEFLESWWASWEEHYHEVQEILDLGHGVVFVALWEGGRPTASKASVREPPWHVYEWLQDKITRTTLYTDPDEARAAAERPAEERG